MQEENCKVIKIKECNLLAVWKDTQKFKLVRLEFVNVNEKIDTEAKNTPKEIEILEKAILNLFAKNIPLKYDLKLLDLDQCSNFSRKVLLELSKIPCGKVVTYKRLAKLSSSPKAIRAVGSVMAKNPFPLIIPCHRVIRSDYKIGNFGGGSWLKEKLLEIETGKNSFQKETLIKKEILF